MRILPEEVSQREFYRILINAVAPRPIAWVSTISPQGHANLAPFSFFNVVSANPPLLGFSPAPRVVQDEHAPKDTLRNVRDTGEFVINVVTLDLAEAMNLTSGEYEHSVDEFELAKLTKRASHVVKPPQVAESPISFECKLHQILEFGKEKITGVLVIGEIISVYMDERALKQGRLDGSAFDLIGRMGGLQYCKTEARFDLERPK